MKYPGRARNQERQSFDRARYCDSDRHSVAGSEFKYIVAYLTILEISNLTSNMWLE